MSFDDRPSCPRTRASTQADDGACTEWILAFARMTPFPLDTGKWTDFLDSLEEPPRELPGVQALFAKRSPFEDCD